eukprot:UN29521
MQGTNEVTVKVSGEYTYGEPVKGNARLTARIATYKECGGYTYYFPGMPFFWPGFCGWEPTVQTGCTCEGNGEYENWDGTIVYPETV